MDLESPPQTQKAAVWYPPAHDIRVEQVPMPKIEHPDDAIVKIKLAGLCGSDLHAYRGDEDVSEPHVCGHELIGHVVALGASFRPDSPPSRPALYATLKIGDKVVAPFTISCGECEFCRLGYTARCDKSCLLGQPILPGGQAQYARIPYAGGTLFSLNALGTPGKEPPQDASLLLLADILPTGMFVALQALSHPKLAPIFSGKPWPTSASSTMASYFDDPVDAQAQITSTDKTLQIAVVGLGPVGLCAVVALLDMLSSLKASYRMLCVDPNPRRRMKAHDMHNVIGQSVSMRGQFLAVDTEPAKNIVQSWGRGGCHAVLEVVGNPSALALSLALAAPAGIISSCGVHQAPAVPFTGRELYNANATLEFGRCSVRAVFPAAVRLLLKRQDIFGAVGWNGLVERVVSLDQAPEAYEKFNRGEWGKVVFDPWV